MLRGGRKADKSVTNTGVLLELWNISNCVKIKEQTRDAQKIRRLKS